jgi:hypothetical protein
MAEKRRIIFIQKNKNIKLLEYCRLNEEADKVKIIFNKTIILLKIIKIYFS